MARARKAKVKAGKTKRAKKGTTKRTKKVASKTKAKRPASRKRRPKRGGLMDDLAKASQALTEGIEDAARMRRRKLYPGIDEG